MSTIWFSRTGSLQKRSLLRKSWSTNHNAASCLSSGVALGPEWVFSLTAYLKQKEKSQCELTETALCYWSDSWTGQCHLIRSPCTLYLFKLPDIRVLFLVVFQRCFVVSSASLCSLKSSNSLERPSAQKGAMLSYQNNLCCCGDPVTQSSCRRVFTACEGREPALKLVLPSPCQFWACLPSFAPPSRAQHRGNMWLRAIFAHMTLHSNSINIKHPLR